MNEYFNYVDVDRSLLHIPIYVIVLRNERFTAQVYNNATQFENYCLLVKGNTKHPSNKVAFYVMNCSVLSKLYVNNSVF